MGETVLKAVEDGVATITLHRPERLNAWTAEMGRAYFDALQECEDSDAVRAIVVTGAGRGFCAGADMQDLQALGEGSLDGSEAIADDRPQTFPLTISKPIVAAVNGAAVAGGFGVMLGCDIIVAAEHATFGLPEVKRGLVGVGATTRASLRLPPAVTLELALTGEPMDAARALHHGLVNRVVPAAEVVPTAVGIARQIAANAPLAVVLAKEIALDARGLLAPDIAAWRERAASVFASDDAKEGARAFAEKRPPRFTGH